MIVVDSPDFPCVRINLGGSSTWDLEGGREDARRQHPAICSALYRSWDERLRVVVTRAGGGAVLEVFDVGRARETVIVMKRAGKHG
jgi:hypothetical protein